jgi:hypothetical protein
MAKKRSAKKITRMSAKASTRKSVKKSAKKVARRRAVKDAHPCYTSYVPGSDQVMQCCWDESINDYRCRQI